MIRKLLLSSVSAGFVTSFAQAAPSPYYNIQDYDSGAGSNGAFTGVYHVSGSTGTIGVDLVGGADPSSTVSGATVDGVAAYLYGRADYDYHITLTTSSQGVGAALEQAARSGGVSEIVGYLSGNLAVASTVNSSVTATLSVLGYAGGDSVYASCAGYFCYSSGPGFIYGQPFPITLAVRLRDFDFGCAPNPNTGVLEGDCSTAVTTVGVRTQAFLRNGPDLSAGSVLASVDPTFTLDPNFLRANGIGPGGLGVGQDSISAVPEPAGWAMMLIGAALVGGALRCSGGLRLGKDVA